MFRRKTTISRMETIIMRHLKWNFLAIYIQFFLFFHLFLCLIAAILYCIFFQILHVSIILNSHSRLACNKHLHFSFLFFFFNKKFIFFCFAIHLSFYSKNLFPVFIFNLIYMVIALGRKQHIHRQALKENKWKSLLIDGGSVNPFKSNPA